VKQIKEIIKASIEVKTEILSDQAFIEQIESAAQAMISTLRSGGKILLCGNGGSAADAQHIAAELSGRFQMDRQPFYAEALHVNSSYLTAVSNDYGFEHAYARLVQAMGKQGDVLIAISTSGNSANILLAAETAKKAGMHVIGMTGRSGGTLAELVDICLCVPSDITARTQEAHIMIGHIFCELVEKELGITN
jgi:D-sedoheptulose 7-phosphate isomerase